MRLVEQNPGRIGQHPDPRPAQLPPPALSELLRPRAHRTTQPGVALIHGIKINSALVDAVAPHTTLTCSAKARATRPTPTRFRDRPTRRSPAEHRRAHPNRTGGQEAPPLHESPSAHRRTPLTSTTEPCPPPLSTAVSSGRPLLTVLPCCAATATGPCPLALLRSAASAT
ncbi:hypothetical protein GCM10010428_30550 [Actinosynnema pretiosum subsp. pretiosum]